jgi:hypothetical protein
MAENIFNKTNLGRGTLIGNWQEENTLREHTGHGRTITKEHISKKHGDLENPILHDKVFDNTKNRINGKTEDLIINSTNSEYGKARNPALERPTVGSRTMMTEEMIQQ